MKKYVATYIRVYAYEWPEARIFRAVHLCFWPNKYTPTQRVERNKQDDERLPTASKKEALDNNDIA